MKTHAGRTRHRGLVVPIRGRSLTGAGRSPSRRAPCSACRCRRRGRRARRGRAPCRPDRRPPSPACRRASRARRSGPARSGASSRRSRRRRSARAHARHLEDADLELEPALRVLRVREAEVGRRLARGAGGGWVISRLNASPPKTPAPVALPFCSFVPSIVPGQQRLELGRGVAHLRRRSGRRSGTGRRLRRRRSRLRRRSRRPRERDDESQDRDRAQRGHGRSLPAPRRAARSEPLFGVGCNRPAYLTGGSKARGPCWACRSPSRYCR